MNKKWIAVALGLISAGGLAYGTTKYIGSKKATEKNKMNPVNAEPKQVKDESLKQLPCPSCGKPVRSYEFYCPFCGGNMEEIKN